jgi:hypothetical protein
MIKKTILVFIILFGVYSLIVTLNPGMTATQHQWQENVVKGEKYIYNTSDTIKSVVVGSSLASRLIMDSLPGFYNLSFAGQGIFDGLEILKRTGKYPKNVFIEMNAILSKHDESFTSTLFSPLSFNVKKYCKPLRSDKQPLAFIFPAIQTILNKKTDHKEYEAKAVTGDPKANAMFTKVLEIQVQNYSKAPDTAYLDNQFKALGNIVADMKSRGVNIVFFEMPLNPALVELTLANAIRSQFYEHFPEDSYNYIKMPDCSNYVTTDGLHLNDKEALWYTSYFKEAAKQY